MLGLAWGWVLLRILLCPELQLLLASVTCYSMVLLPPGAEQPCTAAQLPPNLCPGQAGS